MSVIYRGGQMLDRSLCRLFRLCRIAQTIQYPREQQGCLSYPIRKFHAALKLLCVGECGARILEGRG